MTDTIITKSIDTLRIIIEEENGVEYCHVKCSNVEMLNKNNDYFRKGDEAGGLKVLNEIAALIGVGPITRVSE